MQANPQVADHQATEKPKLTSEVNGEAALGVPAKKIPDVALNHKELIEKIKKEKEKFIQEKKSQEHAEKQAKIEKLVNSSKVDETGAKGITGGEPLDEITKERRNFVKRVSKTSLLVLRVNFWSALLWTVISRHYQKVILLLIRQVPNSGGI